MSANRHRSDWFWCRKCARIGTYWSYTGLDHQFRPTYGWQQHGSLTSRGIRIWERHLHDGEVGSALNYSTLWDGLPRMGFISGKRMEHFIRLVTTNHLQNLIFQFVVATDIETGEKLLFARATYTAVRASISIPGVFTPVRYDNRLLVDGA